MPSPPRSARRGTRRRRRRCRPARACSGSAEPRKMTVAGSISAASRRPRWIRPPRWPSRARRPPLRPPPWTPRRPRRTPPWRAWQSAVSGASSAFHRPPLTRSASRHRARRCTRARRGNTRAAEETTATRATRATGDTCVEPGRKRRTRVAAARCGGGRAWLHRKGNATCAIVRPKDCRRA